MKTKSFANKWIASIAVLIVLLIVLFFTVVANHKDNDTAFYIVDEYPEYPGGRDAYLDYLNEKMVYPDDARRDSIQARVVVQFIVEKDGSITNAKVLKTSSSESLDAEALRLIKRMPKWTPGKLNDTIRRVRMAMPVNFRLDKTGISYFYQSQNIQEASKTPDPEPLIVFPSEAETGQIIKRDNGSITFWVDGELPDPKLYTPGSASPNLLVGDSIDQMVFKCSYDDDSEKFIYFEKPDRGASFNYSTPFFNGMIDAFAFHNPVVLSPDVLWTLVCQGFSHYVNENSESMRDVLVDFNGRKALTVRTAHSPFSEDFDWAAVTADFTRQVRSNVKKKEVVDMVLADFSTTGTDELIASRITLMNTMQKFFEYRMLETICGIPYVTLQGTTDDWKKFADKVHLLRDYGLDWWADQLEPIAAEFIKASQGNPDREFWKNIVKKTRPGELRGYGCLPTGRETKFDGWFLKFLPFTENGMTPSEVCMDDKMLSEICKTDFTYQQVDDNGKLIGSMPMKLWGGIVGCQQDEESTAISFKIGWMASFDIEGVDKEPQFPGGDEALKQYIKERVRMPEEIRKAAAETDSDLTINVGFLIDRDGTILEGDAGGLWWYRWYKSQRGIEDNLDEEFEKAVKAAIESMPKWQPATYGGIAVPFDKDIKVEF